jgi:putative ABC transport system substrate-binding protein
LSRQSARISRHFRRRLAHDAGFHRIGARGKDDGDGGSRRFRRKGRYLLHELAPGAARIALLVNPANPVATQTIITDTKAAAAAIGRQIDVFEAETSDEIETAFAALVQSRADTLLVGAEPFFIDRRVQIVTLATRHLLPTVYFLREFAEIGGLMSYGASDFARNRDIGIYTGRILKGEKPADMPVMQPTQFELVINLPTARAIGIPIPPSLLAQANEVIE